MNPRSEPDGREQPPDQHQGWKDPRSLIKVVAAALAKFVADLLYDLWKDR